MVYVPHTKSFIFECFILNSLNETLDFRGDLSRLRKKEALRGDWQVIGVFLDALASLDFKLSVSGSGMFLQLAHLRVFQIYFLYFAF